jgi:7-cyano-7-deazaguanine synthase in queuosine biosynthesis
VKAFSGVIEGRRGWESNYAAKMAQWMNVQHIPVDDDFSCMSPKESVRLYNHAFQKYDIRSWFVGAAKLWYHPTFHTLQTSLELRKKGVYLPFIDLQKQHTIDLYYQLGVEHLLKDTHSCTAQGVTHCGNCVCCSERVRGFNELGLNDHSIYDCGWTEALREAYVPGRIVKTW